MHLQCEICEEIIATTKPDRLRLPLNTSMFDPRSPEDVNPWPWFLTWLDMKCPHCSNRPFVMTEEEIQTALEHRSEGPSRIKTPNGWFKVGDKYAPGEIPVVHPPIQDEEELNQEWNERMGKGKIEIYSGPALQDPDEPLMEPDEVIELSPKPEPKKRRSRKKDVVHPVDSIS